MGRRKREVEEVVVLAEEEALERETCRHVSIE
jgi:hypothetical protein